MNEIIFLGTGTSGGIPEIGCTCPVCLSTDQHDKRTRTSILIKSKDISILIDAGIDLRQQFLRENIDKVDALLITHTHADHCLGLDDLRAVSFKNHKAIDLYATEQDMKELEKRFDYIFFGPPQKGGGVVKINPIIINKTFFIGDLEITPLPILHGKLHITGYLINKKIIYITDASQIPEKTFSLIPANPEILILNTLKKEKHSTHFNLDESIETAKIIGAKKTYFVHMCHKLGDKETNKLLPKDMKLAYDGEIINGY